MIFNCLKKEKTRHCCWAVIEILEMKRG